MEKRKRVKMEAGRHRSKRNKDTTKKKKNKMARRISRQVRVPKVFVDREELTEEEIEEIAQGKFKIVHI